LHPGVNRLYTCMNFKALELSRTGFFIPCLEYNIFVYVVDIHCVDSRHILSVAIR